MSYSIKRLPSNSFGTAKCNTHIAIYNNSPSGRHQTLEGSYIHVGIGQLDTHLLQQTALYSALTAYKQLFLQVVGHIEHRMPLQAIDVHDSALHARSIQIAEETMPNSFNLDEIIAWNRFVVEEVFTLKPECIVELHSRATIRTESFQSGVQSLPHTFAVAECNKAKLLPITIQNSSAVMEYSTAKIA